MNQLMIEQVKYILQQLIDEKEVERINIDRSNYDDGSHSFEVEVVYKEKPDAKPKWIDEAKTHALKQYLGIDEK